jgi:hypothetical protein
MVFVIYKLLEIIKKLGSLNELQFLCTHKAFQYVYAINVHVKISENFYKS